MKRNIPSLLEARLKEKTKMKLSTVTLTTLFLILVMIVIAKLAFDRGHEIKEESNVEAEAIYLLPDPVFAARPYRSRGSRNSPKQAAPVSAVESGWAALGDSAPTNLDGFNIKEAFQSAHLVTVPPPDYPMYRVVTIAQEMFHGRTNQVLATNLATYVVRDGNYYRVSYFMEPEVYALLPISAVLQIIESGKGAQ